MYNDMFENAYNDALSLAKASELDAKIDTLSEKIDNINKSTGEKVETPNVEKEITPEWLDSVVDLSFLSPEDEEKYKDCFAKNNELTGELNEIYLRLEALSKERAEALKSFDIPKVVEIDTKIEDLNNSYKSKYVEGEELRTQVLGKKNEWELSLNQLKEELGSEKWDKVADIDKTKYSPSVLNEYRASKTYEMVKSFLDDFPKTQVKSILNNPRLKDILKSDYNRLVAEYL